MEHIARSAINQILNEDRLRQENLEKARTLSEAAIRLSALRTLDPNDLVSPLKFSAWFFSLDERSHFVWPAWAKEFAGEVVDVEARRLLTAHVQLIALLARNLDPTGTGVVEVKAALEFAAARFPHESGAVRHKAVEHQRKRPALVAQQQDAAILEKLAERGVDPLKLPKAPLGNKPWPLKDGIRQELGYSTEVMKHAWKRMRGDGKLKDG